MEQKGEESSEAAATVPDTTATVTVNGSKTPPPPKTAEEGDNFNNPDIVPNELKDTFLVDAIGDTLYSKRFVLKTLLNLNKLDSSLSEEFEKDLCVLWDMTVEKDVIKLLLEHNVLEIFSNIIQITDDQRLVEILLGIIGNMCSLVDTRDALCQQPDVMIPIIELISCSDSLILIQLMRLFHTCLVFENCGDEYIWFQHFRCADQFVDKFAFLLSNSMSTTLLLQAYEALNAICTKFAIIEIQPEILDSSGFRNIFVKSALVSGVIEAFKTMLPDFPRALDPTTDANVSRSNTSNQIIDDDISAPTKKTQRIMNLFLDINVILSQYENTSRQCYEPYMNDLMKCISKCLKPLCQPIYLLPLSSNEQILIENVNELIQALNDPFHDKLFTQMIIIWSLIEKHMAKGLNSGDGKGESSEWDSVDDEEVSGMDINMTILEYLTRTSRNATVNTIEHAIKDVEKETIIALYKALSAGDSEDDIKECSDKFREAIKSIWNIEVESNNTVNDDEFSDVDDDDDDVDNLEESGGEKDNKN